MTDTSARYVHVLGVAKGGTTSLCVLLDAHPAVVLSSPKELDDFERYARVAATDLPDVLDTAEHAGRWPDAARERLRLSAVHTLGHPQPFAERFARAFPDPSRALVVLRDPVARLVSAYRYGRVLGQDPGGTADDWVRELVAADRAGALAPREMFDGVRGGRYRDRLEPWVEAYGVRLGVVFTEQLQDHADLARRLGAWLELDPAGWPTAERRADAASNVTRAPRWRTVDRVYRRVVPRVRPLVARWPSLLRARDAYWRLNRGPDVEVPSDDVLAEVRAYYDERNRGLKALLDRASVLADEVPDWVRP